jgi:hypothetical protein
MHAISVIYRKPGDPQKYITVCRMPGEHYDERKVKQDCMDYGVEYISSRLEQNPFIRFSVEEKKRLGVIRKPYYFFENKNWRRPWI